jgi:hypothetical protein
MRRWGRGPVLIRRFVRKLSAERWQLYRLDSQYVHMPTRRHVYFSSGSSGAVFGSVTVVCAAFMIIAKKV